MNLNEKNIFRYLQIVKPKRFPARETKYSKECKCGHFIDSAYIRIAGEFVKLCEEARQANSANAYKGLGILVHAHNLVFGVIAAELERHAKQGAEVDESAKRRLFLTAAFIQGISLCEQTIAEGLYGQAGALLRQEIECLAAIKENTKKKRKDGRTPNVVMSPWKMGKKYGELSDIAHLSNHDILEALYVYSNEWGRGAGIVPQYVLETTKFFYGAHVAALLAVASDIDQLYQDIYKTSFGDREYEAMWVAHDILCSEGVLVGSK